MNDSRLEDLARQLQQGTLDVAQFLDRLQRGRTADLGVAQVDLDRERRCGFPEVVFGQGKTPEALVQILQTLVNQGSDAFATRISAEQAAQLSDRFPGGYYNGLARTFRVPVGSAGPPHHNPLAKREGGRKSVAGPGATRATPHPGPLSAGEGEIPVVVIVTAGTSDLPIAEEARETALWMGVAVKMIHDVGVAGPHRLPMHLDKLRNADAVVVIAGMEGALPSVVGGYVDCPVIAVPTSVGYGASFGGVSALLGMLNSCASNVTVVNIDSGFKGAYVAGLIARNATRRRQGAT